MAVIFFVAILVFSVVIHEVSHGWVADYLGDPTARLAGRLTLNPISHIDPMGSILLPFLMMALNTGFIFGWAKPVPYNPYNLKGGKWGPAIVALAGPGSNLLIALVFSLLVRLVPFFSVMTMAGQISTVIILLNITLAIFNLFPVPPLDGSKILFAILPHRLRQIEEFMIRYQLILVLILLFTVGAVLVPIVDSIFTAFTGWPVSIASGL